MLRSEFRLRNDTALRRALTFFLGEAFLGFLAIVATALTLLPMIFEVSAEVDAWVEGGQWAIIALFAVEYAVALAWSRRRRDFLLNPWRLLDLVTIVVPVATLLPSVSGALRSSPILRLVRLVRVVTLGVRASGAVVRESVRRAAETAAAGPARITLLHDAARGAAPADVSWNEFLQWVKSPGPEWYHVLNPSVADLEKIAATAGVPAVALEAHLLGTGYPHVESVGEYSGLFVWLPELAGDGQIERQGVFLLIGAENLLSFSRLPARLLERVAAVRQDAAEAAKPFAGRMARLFLRAVLAQNEKMVGFFEQELHGLEEVPVRESRAQFFEGTFRLKKGLSAAQSDLWRMKSLLAELAEGRARLPGTGAEEAQEFRRLADDADYLYETIVNTREEVLSLIDLHLNVVSFDMNRVMRVLAVVSALGLIPAVVGGLLGMNLVDNPWSFTLPQVAFSVCLGMIVALYFFFVKGWLR